VSLVGTLLAVAGAYYTVLLYKNLRPDMEELLPTTSRSVKDLNEVSHRMEAIDNLVILVTSNNPMAGKRFVTDLAKRLETYPRTTIASVEYRIDREMKFFKDREALFLSTHDLERIRDYIRDKIRYETEIRNPLYIFNGEELDEPKLDFDQLRAKYRGRAEAFTRFPGGFYATPDGKLRAVILYMPGKSSNTKAVRALKAAAATTVEALDPKSYAPDLVVRYTGNVQNVIEEQAALMADLERSTVIVVVIVTLLMLLYYRSITATLVLVLSLFMGTFWTFGVAYFAVGYLNANSAFLASIVIGNGINFGIIFIARYLEERRRPRRVARSIYQAMLSTPAATATAALAAGLSYGSLMLTSFRGFSQFGFIGLVGMVLCWISAYTLLPAFLVLAERRRPGTVRTVARRSPKSYFAAHLANLIDRYPRPIWIAALLASAISTGSILTVNHPLIEMDLSKLRDKQSMENGSGYLQRYVREIFGRTLSPLAILASDQRNARAIAEKIRERAKAEGPDGSIKRVQMIDDFVPREQARKIAILKEIRTHLPMAILARIPVSERRMLQGLIGPEVLRGFTERDLPGLVRSKFREKDGRIGNLVLVERKGASGVEDAQALIGFVAGLRGAADAVQPGVSLAGQVAVTSDMAKAIIKDGPKATVFAFSAVLILVILVFRHPVRVSQVIISLLLGVLWMAGAMMLFELNVNFLSFVALPITFGIGVDYAVNVFQRYQEAGPGKVVEVVRHTGGAVILASLTTIIGYGSLLVAGNQAFVSFGCLAVLGEVTCLGAAVFALPAFLRTLELRKLSKAAAKVDNGCRSKVGPRDEVQLRPEAATRARRRA